jgi:hypothetical protein
MNTFRLLDIDHEVKPAYTINRVLHILLLIRSANQCVMM